MRKYRIDINIVDDHAMFTESLADEINATNVAYVSHTFATLDACRQVMAERCPDVLLLDISVPEKVGEGITEISNSVAFCRQMLAEHQRMKIVCVTIHDEYSVIRRMLDGGVHGYLLKSSPVTELIETVQAVWQGQRYISREVEKIISASQTETVLLTNVERSVLQMICDGHTNPEIAESLSLSTETINWYRKRLLAKFGVKNTVGLVSLVLKQKIL